MRRFGISVELKHVPALEPDFMHLMRFNRAFLDTAKKPVDIAVKRTDGQIAVRRTFIHGTPEMAEADLYYVERFVKTMLWTYGGGIRITDWKLVEGLNRLYGVLGRHRLRGKVFLPGWN